jgi:MHS family proline/betaine transporter-like MFS transporter|eukprot:COSAG02_NODE_2512_length_8621_cov_278.639062_2_plen_738_part_00
MATVNGVKAAKKAAAGETTPPDDAPGSGRYAPLGMASVADEGQVAQELLKVRGGAAEGVTVGGVEPDADDLRQLLLVTLISSVGTILEWFDFACFGYFASTFSHLFFPAEDKVASLAAAFAVFAGAFIMRPVGGVLFGYIGDRHGRKRAVLLSVFLMAGSTFSMGCLPTYEMVGPVAPVLLTLARCLQGISSGGQLAGSFCFVVELAGPKRGAMFGAISLGASVMGTALGSLCAAVLHMPSVISEEALESWGWRVPFLLGLLVGVVAHLVKDSVHEGAAPEPDELAGAGGVNPFKAALTNAWREILLVAGTTFLWSAGFYVVTTWVPTFAANPDLIDRPMPDAFGINSGLMIFASLVLFPCFGYVATKFTPEATMQAAALAGLLLCLPSFGLILHDTESTLLVGQGTLVVVISAYGAALPSWMVFNTPRQCRYTVIGLGYNLAHATVGGTAPMFSTLLLRWTGSAMSIGVYFGILCIFCGSVLTWHTGRKTRRNGVGDNGGVGRRGYAQLDRASTFDEDSDGENTTSGVNSATQMIGQFGDEPKYSPPTAGDAAAAERSDTSGTGIDETTAEIGSLSADTVEKERTPALPPRGDDADGGSATGDDERESLIRALPPLPPSRTRLPPVAEEQQAKSANDVSTAPAKATTHSVNAAVVDAHHQGEMGERLRLAGARVGRLTCSLMWHNTDDLDLHCVTPFDEHLHWNNHKGKRCGGHLDVDMNASDRNLSSAPIENLVW